MNNTMINKSFLYILSPPFIRSLAPPNLLSIPITILTNFCSIFNIELKKITIYLVIFFIIEFNTLFIILFSALLTTFLPSL